MQNTFSQYLNAIPLSVILVDTEGDIEFANESAIDLFRFQKFKPHKYHVTDIEKLIEISPGEKNNLITSLFKSQKKSKKKQIILKFTHKKIVTSVTAQPIINKDKDLHQVMITFEDISIKSKQEEFQKLYIKLLGHELKQPLGLIKAYVYSLRKSILNQPEKGTQYLDKTDMQVSVLTQMLNDITDATKFSLNMFDVTKEPIDIVQLLDEIYTDQKTAHKHHKFLLKKSTSKPIIANVDPLRIRQAIMNLINNATKYSDTGSTVTIQLSEKKGQIIIQISDEGNGINPKHLTKIFEPYYRSVQEKRVRGLGLGLALVKNVAVRHHGKVEAKNNSDQGSTFTLTFPKNHA